MIYVSELFYRYPNNDKPTLNGLTFEINAGEIFGFLGPSGSGKSTTQKLLIGLLRGHTGVANLFGEPLNAWGPEVYHRLGVGFELPNHFIKLTAKENLLLFSSLYGLAAKSARLRVDQLLEEMGLTDAADQATGEFSKGMKMRLNFARALLPNPELLFLDEPTSGLDPVNAAKIRDMIAEQRRLGKTIFLTTHNMYDADELCDRVAFIVDGHIKLLDEPRRMKAIYGQRTLDVEQRDEANQIIKTRFNLDTLATNTTFQKQLATLPIETIHSNEATLEDVFIKVTGAQLI
jgi:fluoroquinolone transport system ATP-binding protein